MYKSLITTPKLIFCLYTSVNKHQVSNNLQVNKWLTFQIDQRDHKSS